MEREYDTKCVEFRRLGYRALICVRLCVFVCVCQMASSHANQICCHYYIYIHIGNAKGTKTESQCIVNWCVQSGSDIIRERTETDGVVCV